MFDLFRVLKERLRHVEFYFDHDVRYVMPDAHVISEAEGRTRPWAGVLNHNPEKSEISLSLRWKIHFYKCPVEIAKDVLDPYPYDEGDASFAVNAVDDDYVVIVPKSGWWPRDWPVDRMKRVAQWLDMNGVTAVVVGKDVEPFDVEGYEFKHLVDLQGKTTIAQMAALMKGSRLVISPDTGPIHVAGSLGCEIVAPWGPSVHKLTAPLHSTPVLRNDNGCVECYGRQKVPFHSICNYTAECMRGITVNQVIEAVAAKLDIEIQTKPTVSLVMMVKNEERMLPGAIKAAQPLVDEIVVVDTGSTDGTLAWLGEQTDVKVFHYDIGSEIESFSDVRNFGISKATCKYVVWMDACERLIDARDVKKLVEREGYDCYAFPVQHVNYRYTREKIVPRMFATFVDRVHEFIPCGGLKDGTVLPSLGVLRLPYEKVDRESSENRNIRLLKRQLEESPESPRRPRWLFYLGRDLCDAKRYDEAIPHLKQRVFMEGFYEERFAAGVLLSRIYIYEKKDYERAEHTAEALIHLKPKLREGYYIKAESLYWREQYADAMKLYQAATQIPRPVDATMWLWEEVYTWLPHDRMSRIWELLGKQHEALKEAGVQLRVAPPGEHGWIVERIKALNGVPTLA
jgi:glycosyltransferase involved in cell wall biosynthesis